MVCRGVDEWTDRTVGYRDDWCSTVTQRGDMATEQLWAILEWL